MKLLDQVRTRPEPISARPRSTWSENLVTSLFGLWLVGGLFGDLWSHNHVRFDTFFTPFHIDLYIATTTTFVWLLYVINRRRVLNPQGRWPEWVPVGYGAAMIGVIFLFAAGPLDFLSHHYLGVERGITAFTSPTHLLGITGMSLLNAGPLLSAWHRLDPWEERFKTFVPVALPAALITTILVHFSVGLDAFASSLIVTASGKTHNSLQAFGASQVVVTMLLLMGPVLFLLIRWRIPFGTITALFSVPAVADAAIHNLHPAPAIVAGIVGGFIGDLLVLAFRPAVQRRLALRAFAMLTPLVFASLYLGLFELKKPLAWSIPVWAGELVLGPLVGLLLTLLVIPPRLPAEVVVAQSRAAGDGVPLFSRGMRGDSHDLESLQDDGARQNLT